LSMLLQRSVYTPIMRTVASPTDFSCTASCTTVSLLTPTVKHIHTLNRYINKLKFTQNTYV
jgi:hypothetical protein